MLMQSYDFLMLSREYGCKIELGGDDQWSNILGGIDLCRRKDQKQVYGMTFTLLTNSEGKKMGKTQSGALWLDPEKTSPYDFYQYWVNVDDADVIKCLKLLTFLPLEEIEKMAEYKDAEINKAKKVLAYEVTKLVHGEEEAEKAKAAADAVFGSGASSENMPTTEILSSEISNGLSILDCMVKAGIIASKGEGRRLIQQGGVSLNGDKVTDANYVLAPSDFESGEAVIKKGKKVFHRILVK